MQIPQNPELDHAAQCGPGLACVDNCPEGAQCFVSIFTCQETKRPAVTVIKDGFQSKDRLKKDVPANAWVEEMK